jgi:hypothetical protein
MEKLLIDPKPKYLPLYEPIEPPLLPAKYTESITTVSPVSPTMPISVPIPVPADIIEDSSIPKKSFSYIVIIGIVSIVFFVFYAIYYTYKSNQNRKNHILPMYIKNYKVSLDEMKDDSKKYIKSTVDTLISYRDYIQNLSRKYFYGMRVEKGTLRTSAPRPAATTIPKKKPEHPVNTPTSTTAKNKSTVTPANTTKSTPAKTTAPTTIIKEKLDKK